MNSKYLLLLTSLLAGSGTVQAQQPASVPAAPRQTEVTRIGETPIAAEDAPLEFIDIQELVLPELPKYPKISSWSIGEQPLWNLWSNKQIPEKERMEMIRLQRGREQSLLLQSNPWNKHSFEGSMGAFQFKISGGGGAYNPFDMTAHLDARRLMFPTPRHNRPDNPGPRVAPNGKIRR